MKDIVLSKRMETVVSMVSPQSFAVADVGCDHAYVSIALAQRKLADKVIAMDVRKGPLAIASGNVELYGLQDVIELRLSDGLEKLVPDEVETIIIAGMGGLLMKRILQEGKNILSGESIRPVLILQPQSDIREIRIFLYQNAYHIVREQMLMEDGKYYTVLRAEPTRQEERSERTYNETEWIYGRYELEHKDPILYDYLYKQRQTLMSIRTRLETSSKENGREEMPQKTIQRYAEIEKELKNNAEALAYYG